MGVAARLIFHTHGHIGFGQHRSCCGCAKYNAGEGLGDRLRVDEAAGGECATSDGELELFQEAGLVPVRFQTHPQPPRQQKVKL